MNRKTLFRMKFFLIILSLFFFSCEGNKQSELSILIDNSLLANANLLNIKIINNSDNNYFIIIDKAGIPDRRALNYEINNNIHLKPKFYLESELVNSSLQTIVYKKSRFDKSENDCLKKEIADSKMFLQNMKNLKEIIIIPKNTSVSVKIPFSTDFLMCNKPFHYLLHKNIKYEVEFEYKMSQEFINNYISESKLSVLKNQNISPYLYKISSNKIPLIVN